MEEKQPLSALRKEIWNQPGELTKSRQLNVEKATQGSIFVGAGDSLASALVTSYLSAGDALAYDPYSLLASPDAAIGKDVYILSVSGRTRSNILLARRLKRIAKRTIAVTSNPNGELAHAVEETIQIPYTGSGRVSGTQSFTLSLFTSLRIAMGKISCDFASAFEAAQRSSKKLVHSRTGTNYFLGNNAMYGIAVYAAAKIYEVLGFRAHAEFIEEYSHMELFSMEKADCVNILPGFDPEGARAKLNDLLTREGYASRLIPSFFGTDVENIFHAAFLVQIGIYRAAINLGLKDLNFVLAKERLKISDAMIY
jgi:glucosamine 6-phosphate synthetase-like amidotransferase/phosphosugar isomerase protein